MFAMKIVLFFTVTSVLTVNAAFNANDFLLCKLFCYDPISSVQLNPLDFTRLEFNYQCKRIFKLEQCYNLCSSYTPAPNTPSSSDKDIFEARVNRIMHCKEPHVKTMKAMCNLGINSFKTMRSCWRKAISAYIGTTAEMECRNECCSKQWHYTSNLPWMCGTVIVPFDTNPTCRQPALNSMLQDNTCQYGCFLKAAAEFAKKSCPSGISEMYKVASIAAGVLYNEHKTCFDTCYELE